MIFNIIIQIFLLFEFYVNSNNILYRNDDVFSSTNVQENSNVPIYMSVSAESPLPVTFTNIQENSNVNTYTNKPVSAESPLPVTFTNIQENSNVNTYTNKPVSAESLLVTSTKVKKNRYISKIRNKPVSVPSLLVTSPKNQENSSLSTDANNSVSVESELFNSTEVLKNKYNCSNKLFVFNYKKCNAFYLEKVFPIQSKNWDVSFLEYLEYWRDPDESAENLIYRICKQMINSIK